MPRVAYLHIGAPKTGTTFLQAVLWAHREKLEKAGLHLLGDKQAAHYRAGKDLMELPFEAGNPGIDWTGAWDGFADEASRSKAPAVFFTDEHLASLSHSQIARAVESLAPREVHVVYACRDLRGLLPSEWQEFVKHRSTLPFDEWVTRLFETPDKAPGKWFWSVQDPVDVVKRWTALVPVDNFHIVTLPPRGSPKDELWRRLSQVLKIDAKLATKFEVAANSSLGWAETELLRRVNTMLPPDFPRWHNTALTRDLLATRILSPRSSSEKPDLPDSLSDTVRKRSEHIVGAITASGCHVVGNVDDLRSAPVTPQPRALPGDEVILDAAVAGIASLLVEMARMRDNQRRTVRRLQRQAAPVQRARRRRLAALTREIPGAHRAARKLRALRARRSAKPT